MEEGLIKDLSGEISFDIHSYSPLALAFIGDAVYELYIRTCIIKNTNAPANQLHKKCVSYVKAEGQCEAFDRIQHLLTDDEMSAFKRGRNTKVNTKSKSADLAGYKKATGFETLIGHLYVTGQTERLEELMKTAAAFDE